MTTRSGGLLHHPAALNLWGTADRPPQRDGNLAAGIGGDQIVSQGLAVFCSGA
jgi:hypothetical protein